MEYLKKSEFATTIAIFVFLYLASTMTFTLIHILGLTLYVAGSLAVIIKQRRKEDS
ncbi:hypothetical protein [Levilactobacillus enshiensis]|uniref:hypothetical protein n=1 Tax=Levilactobacillus enshiensis TaxID=2590213 RepID=UPI00131C9007|nr:hypothetical protein [Levilactobacillus enshiensis]